MVFSFRPRSRGRISGLARQLAFTDQPVRLYHYRDRDQYEVDAVLESASGEVVACEGKAAETVRSEDFRDIQRLARSAADSTSGGAPASAPGWSAALLACHAAWMSSGAASGSTPSTSYHVIAFIGHRSGLAHKSMA